LAGTVPCCAPLTGGLPTPPPALPLPLPQDADGAIRMDSRTRKPVAPSPICGFELSRSGELMAAVTPDGALPPGVARAAGGLMLAALELRAGCCWNPCPAQPFSVWACVQCALPLPPLPPASLSTHTPLPPPFPPKPSLPPASHTLQATRLWWTPTACGW
jgi:hypothetical protein